MKLTTELIVDAGMAVFAEVGYQGLSMREVARRLDVHAGSLYYHVRNKSALVALMAERVAGLAYEEGSAALAALPEDADWQDRVEAQLVALRRSVQRHPGGAVLLADSPKTLSAGALSLMERLLRTLADAGLPAEHRIVAADALLSHVTGFVLQEQGETPPPTMDHAADVADAADAAGAAGAAGAVLDDLRERFPLTMAEAPTYDQDEKFLRGVRLFCAGVRALAEDTRRHVRA
ncbi:transcriptional regulator, TetR family [Streptoalloteichus tenebrarius]|uniref:Transcriptional regulator, TetR family n=1 Tax=Streptoalloteichus tenebrarius (strain ATCC 17920 / DSM 40477 / JCM 4838 / CBS 697.72 / NBRC 16177 / NCIMB 11028 / NRRL B-12390 / A12253. 1 / ISP 5477) TaxID=1933 RepID=A0ABT1HLF8_STRSD|nr:TetR/AcrR family transcriptional regulator [Streptoalloteichus tenebrarius]MCP2256333.1 transcriptional regulator, TetR family [Streptoalloteichus tenebrarius]BFF04672.1 hypothetical protein GCM10020241_63470 [Streptoalloteichus tenebrarius]